MIAPVSLLMWLIGVNIFFVLPPFKAKQVELQFTVGEAITNAAIGTSSGAARDPWTCTEDQYSPPRGVYFLNLLLHCDTGCYDEGHTLHTCLYVDVRSFFFFFQSKMNIVVTTFIFPHISFYL